MAARVAGRIRGVPGARRLAAGRRLRVGAARLRGLAAARQVRVASRRPPASRGLPGDDRRRRAVEHRHVEWRRRQHRALGGAFPSVPSSRFRRSPPRCGRGRLADHLRRSRAVLRHQRRDDRRVGPRRRSGECAARAPHHAAAAARPVRRSAGSRLREARLALVALRQRDHFPRSRRAPRLRPPRTLQLRLPAQGEGVGRRRLLAEGDSSRRAAHDVGAGEGNHRRRRRARNRGAVLRSPRQPAAAARARGRRLLQRHRHAEPAAGVEVETLSGRPGEFDRQASGSTS